MTGRDVEYWLALRMERVEGYGRRTEGDCDDVVDYTIQLALDSPEDEIVAEVSTEATTMAEADRAKASHAIADRMVEAWNEYRDAAAVAPPPDRPEIICLCGSSRFVSEMAVIAWGFEKDGKIAMGLHLMPESYGAPADHLAEAEGVAEQMDELHLRKIDLADRVFVVNVGGYIGDSTRREIEYAAQQGKPIVYLEPEPCPVDDCDEPPGHI